jgi:hypothetical protein
MRTETEIAHENVQCSISVPTARGFECITPAAYDPFPHLFGDDFLQLELAGCP